MPVAGRAEKMEYTKCPLQNFSPPTTDCIPVSKFQPSAFLPVQPPPSTDPTPPLRRQQPDRACTAQTQQAALTEAHL